MRSFTSSSPSWSASRIARRLGDVEAVLGLDAPGDLEHGVEPGADPARLGALVAGALELVDLALDGLAHVLGQLARLELGPVVVGVGVVGVTADSPSSLRMASSWRRSRNSRCVFSMPSSTSVLIFSRKVEVGQGVAGPAEHEAQPRLDVERLEHLDLLGEREVGRVAGHVGQAARLGDLAQLRGDAAGAAGVQDVLEHGAVLPGQLVGGRGGLGLGQRLGLDPQGVAGAGHPGADDGAAVTPDGHRGQAAGQVALLHHLGDHADAGVAALDVGHEQQPPPAERAESTAARASSDSRAMVKTIPGSTTPEVRGSNGSVTFSFVMGFFLWKFL